MSWTVLGEVDVGSVLSRFPWSQSQAHGCVPVQAAWCEQQRCWRVAVTQPCWGEHSVSLCCSPGCCGRGNTLGAASVSPGAGWDRAEP